MSILQTGLTSIFCLLTLVISHRAAAQEDPIEDISFRVLCFEYRDKVTSVLASAANGEKITVPLYTSGFSEVMKAGFSGGKASFFTEETLPDGKIRRNVVAEGKLASGTSQAFLLVPTKLKTGPIYRIIAFDDSEKSFPMGATRVINLAKFPIRLNLAGVDMPPIKPGGLGMYNEVRKVDSWNMYTARIQFQLSPDKWVDVATQSWKSSDRKRDWVITRFNETTKEPAIRQYMDIPPWRRTVLATP